MNVSCYIRAAIRAPFETLEFTIFCDASTPEDLVVKFATKPLPVALLSSLEHKFVARVLQLAAEDNRLDVARFILRKFEYEFESAVVDHVLIYAKIYKWDKGVVWALEGRKEFLRATDAAGHP